MPPIAPDSEKGVYDGRVVFVRNLIGKIFLMRLSCPEIAAAAQPGQFVNVKVNRELIPLLRKPFSVCDSDPAAGSFDLLFKVIGKGTQALSVLKQDDIVNVIGPLGHGYDISTGTHAALLVAGGLGVAPLPLLCKRLLQQGTPVEIYLGARVAHELALVQTLAKLGPAVVVVTTEDGSVGERGLVTDTLERKLTSLEDASGYEIYSCGPAGLLRRVGEISEQFGLDSQVAIETMMGCGFGICMGCPVRMRHVGPGEVPYKLTCVDGPVFHAKDILIHG